MKQGDLVKLIDVGKPIIGAYRTPDLTDIMPLRDGAILTDEIYIIIDVFDGPVKMFKLMGPDNFFGWVRETLIEKV